MCGLWDVFLKTSASNFPSSELRPKMMRDNIAIIRRNLIVKDNPFSYLQKRWKEVQCRKCVATFRLTMLLRSIRVLFLIEGITIKIGFRLNFIEFCKFICNEDVRSKLWSIKIIMIRAWDWGTTVENHLKPVTRYNCNFDFDRSTHLVLISCSASPELIQEKFLKVHTKVLLFYCL